jgi:hypothetical protein
MLPTDEISFSDRINCDVHTELTVPQMAHLVTLHPPPPPADAHTEPDNDNLDLFPRRLSLDDVSLWAKNSEYAKKLGIDVESAP